MNVENVVLNGQKCNQCLKGLFCEGVLYLPLSLSFSLYLSLPFLFVGQVMSPRRSDQK